MTATSVIPGGGEDTAFALSFFSFFTYAITARRVIWLCLRGRCRPAACSSHITSQKRRSFSQQPSPAPSERGGEGHGGFGVCSSEDVTSARREGRLALPRRSPGRRIR